MCALAVVSTRPEPNQVGLPERLISMGFLHMRTWSLLHLADMAVQGEGHLYAFIIIEVIRRFCDCCHHIFFHHSFLNVFYYLVAVAGMSSRREPNPAGLPEHASSA